MNNITYTSATIKAILAKQIKEVEATLVELEHQREALLTEHGELYALLMGAETPVPVTRGNERRSGDEPLADMNVGYLKDPAF